MSSARVVITGLGAVTPLGLNVSQMWDGLSTGRCGIDTITAFDPVGFTCKLAGQAPEFKIQKYVLKSHRKQIKLMSRDIKLSIVAAKEALESSGLITKGIDPENINVDPERFGINLGAGMISCDLIELAPAVAASITDGNFDIQKWGKDGIEQVTPLWLLKYLPNMLACHLSIFHDIRGPSNTITCAEASAHIAITEAAQVIERRGCDIALAGAADAKVNPVIIIRQCLLKRTNDNSNDDPATACRPFDADAKGSIFGEAGGIITLESLDNASNRNANILAEFAGAGHSNSINPKFESIEPDGEGIRTAIETALADAKIKAEDLDLIIPHGTGIGDDDLAEAKAIEAVLGPATTNVPVWPTKSMLSNTGAASGAIDVIAGVCAIKHGKIPPARNYENNKPTCNLNIPTKTIEKDIRNVLCTSYTFGGQTAAVVLKKFDG